MCAGLCLGLVNVMPAQSDEELPGLGWREGGHTVGGGEDVAGGDETAATEVLLPHVEGRHVGVGVGSHHGPVHDVAGGGRAWGDRGGQQGTAGVGRGRPDTTALVTST